MPDTTIQHSVATPGVVPRQDLNDLYLFALVVDQGSFTAAARAAGLTTSRVSRRIADLERRLAVHLLHRTTRKLSLTPIGELYYRHCRAMVSEAQAAAEAIEQLQSSPRGRLRITCPVFTAASMLGPVITDFMQAYPEVQVVVAATDRVVNLVDEGFDVAIRFQAAPLEDSGLVARRVGESRSLLVAAPAYLAAHGHPAQPTGLSGAAALVKTRGDGGTVWRLTGADGDVAAVHLRPLLESDDWMMLHQAALAGLGIAALPAELCRRDIAAGALEAVLDPWRLPSASLHIVYTSRRGLIPAVRAFIDFAAQRLEAQCRRDAA